MFVGTSSGCILVEPRCVVSTQTTHTAEHMVSATRQSSAASGHKIICSESHVHFVREGRREPKKIKCSQLFASRQPRRHCTACGLHGVLTPCDRGCVPLESMDLTPGTSLSGGVVLPRLDSARPDMTTLGKVTSGPHVFREFCYLRSRICGERVRLIVRLA